MSGADTVGDAVVAGAGAGELEDAIRASKRKKRDRDSAFDSPTPDGVCSNCSTTLSGPVCHSCGQTADNYHRPVWELMAEVLDGLFGIEGRLWRTLPPLMFQPGKLTKSYLSGVRARYVMPFRLYLTASVLFFLIFFSINSLIPSLSMNDVEAAQEGLAVAQEEMETRSEDLANQLAQEGLSAEDVAAVQAQIEAAGLGLEGLSETLDDPEAAARTLNDWRNELKSGLCQSLTPEDCPREEAASDTPAAGEELAAGDTYINEDGDLVMGAGDGINLSVDGMEGSPYALRAAVRDQLSRAVDDNGAAAMRMFQELIPTAMFFMLPIYALLLGMTHFYKRGYFYYDHVVVSLHFHAFLFFLFLLMMPIGAVIGAWSVLILIIWSNYYLYRMHRVVYSHGRFSSILRTLFMDLVYLIILSVAMSLLFIASVMMFP
ncbi:DUF3667 domain-containing protein [Maricaulis sp.]|uniref:DUF3667 domain-containing protein n=1 Tax=Maricaulis sp. TaxID=1486257 RepID=UPI00260C32DF|nr:DUF3667 domain-containing protein [Maricaulis sp.]